MLAVFLCILSMSFGAYLLYSTLSKPIVKQPRGFEMVNDNFTKIRTATTRMPERSTKNSACYDIFSKETIEIKPNEKYKFTTDIKAYMNEDEVLLIFIRSSQGMKLGLQLTNQTGVIDADFHNNSDNDGNICVELKNESDKLVTVNYGDKIAQAMFTKYLITEHDHLQEKKERVGGIGSTGK